MLAGDPFLTRQNARVALQINDGELVFRFAGEIDASNADTISSSVLATCSEHTDLVVIDLTDVTFIDSSGLTAIIKCRRALTECGVAIEVRNPSARVRRLFEITGLTALLA